MYEYDEGGNLLHKRKYAITDRTLEKCLEETCYSYSDTDWRDLLTAVKGEPIAYDKNGCPSCHFGIPLVFTKEGFLSEYGDNRFSYNEDGCRIQKNATSYKIDGGKILSETTDGNTIEFFYGMTGVVGMMYKGEPYYYQKELYGNIKAIWDKRGICVAEYAYDAWGNAKILTDPIGIATVNPFRYKSHYMDVETGLYYIDGRYYDPKLARYISPCHKLDPWSFSGCNLFLFENNDPINTIPCCGQVLLTDKYAFNNYDQLLKSVQTFPFEMMTP